MAKHPTQRAFNKKALILSHNSKSREGEQCNKGPCSSCLCAPLSVARPHPWARSPQDGYSSRPQKPGQSPGEKDRPFSFPLNHVYVILKPEEIFPRSPRYSKCP